MSLNNSLSMEDKNQFMPTAQKNKPPNFDTFMQACFTNPSFFQSMKSFYMTQNQMGEQQTVPNYQAGLLNQSNHQSQPNLANNSRFQHHQEDSRSEYCEKEVNVTSTRATDMKRKPGNPLSKYYPTDNIQNQKANEPLSKPTAPINKPISFEQRPIKTDYTATVSNNSQSFDLNAIKQNQSINVDNPKRVRNFDDMPIKGMKDFQIESHYKQEQKKSKPVVYSNQDQRPIKSLTTDFKTYVKQTFPQGPFEEEAEKEEASQLENKSTQPRTFLKRGSRQHLSSAANRSKQPKSNMDNSFNKSELDDPKQRSITPRKNQPENRGASQNRVLGKRNAVAQQKSISKRQKKNEQSDEEKVIVKARPPLAKDKVKNQYKIAKTNEKVQIAPVVVKNDKKRKAKNVFNDDSESEVESQEQSVPYFKGNDKKAYQPSRELRQDPSDMEDKMEVIDGLFITKEQLEQIVEKYGKVKQAPRQTESEKVVSLRKKYNEMIALKDEELERSKQDLERQKQQFQKYKSQQMTKLKNERRVMERQVKGGVSGPNMQKQKQELQNLKQEIERQRQDFKRKQKNNKIILQKYKKQNEELKNRLERFEHERDNNNAGSKRNLANAKSEEALTEERVNKNQTGNSRAKKIQQQQKNEEISYRDIKKQSKPIVNQVKQVKPKYEYVEEQPIKNKSMSVKNDKKQVKIQNKWESHRFNQDSSNSESEKDEQLGGDEAGMPRLNEWSPTMKISDLSKMRLSIKMVNEQMISSLFRYQRNLQYVKYMQSVNSPSRTVVNSNRNSANNYTAKLYSDRTKELVYDNGTRKVTCENGFSVVYFKNGDIKQTLPDKTVYYYFKEKEVDQITLPNGVNIYRFENNQVQFHFENGYIEIRHPDGTIKVLGSEHLRR